MRSSRLFPLEWNEIKKSVQRKNQVLTFMRVLSKERSKNGALSRTRGLDTIDRIDEGRDSKSIR